MKWVTGHDTVTNYSPGRSSEALLIRWITEDGIQPKLSDCIPSSDVGVTPVYHLSWRRDI